MQSENQIDLQSDNHPVFQEQGSPKFSFLDMDDNDDADVLYQSVNLFSSAR